jgi:hypothetical protein
MLDFKTDARFVMLDARKNQKDKKGAPPKNLLLVASSTPYPVYLISHLSSLISHLVSRITYLHAFYSVSAVPFVVNLRCR